MSPVLDQEASEGIGSTAGLCDVAVFQQECEAVIVLHGDADVEGGAKRQADRAGGERLAEVQLPVQSDGCSAGFT